MRDEPSGNDHASIPAGRRDELMSRIRDLRLLLPGYLLTLVGAIAQVYDFANCRTVG